jgi:hypothetical protein
MVGVAFLWFWFVGLVLESSLMTGVCSLRPRLMWCCFLLFLYSFIHVETQEEYRSARFLKFGRTGARGEMLFHIIIAGFESKGGAA